jgi:hypothetical protein
VARAQTARPENAATDQGGANPSSAGGITAFEIYQRGLYWWKSGASGTEVIQREGTLAAKSAIGLRDIFMVPPSTRYLGRGYGFQVGGAVRDDLSMYYSANGYLRRKPLASNPAEEGEIITELVFRGDQFVRAPIRANGLATSPVQCRGRSPG